MRVGLIVPGFSADQTDWCIPALRDLARGLSAADDVAVVSVRYPYRSDTYRVDGVPVLALGGARRRGAAVLPLWRQALSRLRDMHRRQAFDVLHAFWATESGLLAAVAGRVLKVPVLVSLAGGELVNLPDIGYGDQRSAWERLKVRASLRLATAVSCGSEYLLRLARGHAPGADLHVAPLGVDLQMFRADARSTARAPRLVHVGALVPVKDQAMLLRAFAGVRQAVRGVTLDLVGTGPLRGVLEHLAADLGLRGAVRFIGEFDHARLSAAYAGASAFVLSSRHEAQGMVVLEAAACGVPTVGTAVGVVPEFAPSAEAVPVGQADALADALRGVLDDPPRALGMASAAREMAETRFGLQTSVDRFRRLYGRVTA